MNRLIFIALLNSACGFTPQSGTYIFQALGDENNCGPAYQLTIWDEPSFQPMTIDTKTNQIILEDSTGQIWDLADNIATYEEVMYVADGGDFDVFITGFMRMEWNSPTEGTGENGLTITCEEADCSSYAGIVDAEQIPCKSAVEFEFSLVE